MPHRVLYLIRNASSQSLLAQTATDHHVSVVLLQDAVSLRELSTPHVYVLEEDARAKNVSPEFPCISYQDMVHMIFEADRVVAL